MRSIIIPSYITRLEQIPIVKSSVSSVIKYSDDYELILINDGGFYPEDLKNEADKYIQFKKNHGVAYAWNEGIKIARGEYIIIVNDDVEVSERWLDGLEKALQFPNAGVAAPGIYGDNRFGIREEKEWFPGFCFMLSRETINKIGLFDENFLPFNGEDIDYWMRLEEKNLTLIRNFDIKIKHYQGQTVHHLDYEKQSKIAIEKFIKKWKVDPIKKYFP
jgi:GT2 family glycosyltransferase